MFFSITALRALAALLITNAHYVGVYPTDIIANGGLLGDVLFFAVSGFCLYNIKLGFGKWYLRRIVRVYPAPIIITAVYMLFGLYSRPTGFISFINWFIYPTYYHFVASILILYIPFYFVAKIQVLRNNIPKLMIAVFFIYVVVYILLYDRSYYHIDNVHEPFIRFLFFEAMLMGGWFRGRVEEFRNKIRITDWIIAAILFVIYFASKLLFVKVEALSAYQILNQLIIIALLFFLMKAFIGIEGKLEGMPEKIKRVISYISEITLEIYVVQYVIIRNLRTMLSFPVNWIVITVLIIVSAALLHIVVKLINKQTDKLFIKKA